MPRTVLAAALTAVLLAGCSTSERVRTETTRIIDTKPKLRVRDPSPVKLGKVEWVVVNEGNIKEVLSRLKGQKRAVLYAVTPDGYRTIISNNGQLIRLVGQQKSVIAALKKYYDEP